MSKILHFKYFKFDYLYRFTIISIYIFFFMYVNLIFLSLDETLQSYVGGCNFTIL